MEAWSKVIFEGDVKYVFDPIPKGRPPPDWSINATILDIRALSTFFVFSSFVWVHRSCNAVAHTTKNFALISLYSYFFNKDNLPLALTSICKEDFPTVSVS